MLIFYQNSWELDTFCADVTPEARTKAEHKDTHESLYYGYMKASGQGQEQQQRAPANTKLAALRAENKALQKKLAQQPSSRGGGGSGGGGGGGGRGGGGEGGGGGGAAQMQKN